MIKNILYSFLIINNTKIYIIIFEVGGKMKEGNRTEKIVMAAMFAALVCVTTMIIKIPSPLKGYINLGDCMVLVAGWTLSPAYAFCAAGIGSALADVFSGYLVYAPATFVIKGGMVFLAYYGAAVLNKKKINNKLVRIISGILAEIWMVLGYLVFEGFLYGFVPSLANVPANALQGIVGIVLAVSVVKMLQRTSLK